MIILNISEKLIRQIINETVKKLKEENLVKRIDKTYYQKTEKLLYSYPDLKKALQQKKDDIAELEQDSDMQNSNSVVLFSKNAGGNSRSVQEKYCDLLEEYRASAKRTELLIRQIERAIDHIKNDIYYQIIELHYFKKEENIEEKLYVSDRTVRRNRKRLVNELQVLLFGADAIDYP